MKYFLIVNPICQKATMICNFKFSQSLILLLHQLKSLKDSIFNILFLLPTTLLSLLLLFLLAYNGLYIFCIYPPSPANTPPVTADFSLGIFTGENPSKPWTSLSSSNLVMNSIAEKHPFPTFKANSSVFNSSVFQRAKRIRKHKRRLRSLRLRPESKDEFSVKIEEFFAGNSCEMRFFITWISPLDSFSEREFLGIQSLFKSHTNACLVIVSNSFDSIKGRQILSPFLENGFPVIAIPPDFDSVFKDTDAESWFNRLRNGMIKPGEVSLGQNLSNLLRLALLYKFGGIYLDADIIILKSFSNLRNVIGAQTIDLETGNWSRLNNAVLIFDKNHPLLFQFIQEFASTFDGNKWGHNGPYLVSRVVSRLDQNMGFNFTILPPSAFYPVVWSKIGGLFEGSKDKIHSKWIVAKLRQISSKSFALHLWNRHSRKLEIEKGSIIDLIRWNCCIFCNHSISSS